MKNDHRQDNCVADQGYACGLFETGYFYGKKKGVDIRTKGSGNSGATNTLRTFGWKAGLVTCLGDILKTVAAVLAVKLIFGRTYTEDIILLELYAGFGAVLGHNFPFYLKFKGRKKELHVPVEWCLQYFRSLHRSVWDFFW